VLVVCAAAVGRAQTYDVVIAGGRIHDGSGGPPYVADIGIKDGRIAALGQLPRDGGQVIPAQGLAVAPGFINMLSWATDCLLVDGRSQSDIRQGVTLEVMGEGWSMGPLNDAMKRDMAQSQGELKFPVEWTTLGEYLDTLVRRGVSTNVASFVGAATVRVHTVGYVDRPATARELQQMCDLVHAAMRDGAVGVSSALIYAPGSYARPEELTALAQVAGQYGGLYISHIRSEGDRLLEELDELIATARQANVAVELYHMKAAGQSNWDKCEAMIRKIEKARAGGLRITADMYTYTAGSTGLDAAMPPWVQEGGHRAWVTRLRDPAIRQRVLQEMTTPSGAPRVEGVPPSNRGQEPAPAQTGDARGRGMGFQPMNHRQDADATRGRGQDARDTGIPSAAWENFYLLAGSPENILFVGFKNEKLRPLIGKTLAQVAALRGKSPPETIIDLVVEDDSRVNTVYFLMSEENVKRQIQLPWVSFCSDAGSLAPEGVFLKSSTHPRAYGNFARLLGKYVREEKVLPLQEAIRRLTALPAANLRLDRRGKLEKGYHADIVVFDPATVRDHATYENPRQYATGVVHVFVNGTQVLKDGEHTGAKPGQVVRGPGWKP
jgi:N-acyl-D-amino-acid deacylase